MLTFDDEEMVVDYFRDSIDGEIPFFEIPSEAKKIIQLIKSKQKWKNWINSSGKSAPPPDFYNDKEMLMMEVMRIDDNAFINDKNQSINLVKVKEKEAFNKINKMGFNTNEKTKFVALVSTDLPTDEDHNFDRYFKNFCRVLEKHKKSIPIYRKNHKDYKLIFLLFDESSAYMEMIAGELFRHELGNKNAGSPHIPFWDEQFYKKIKELDIDYFIWFTPYKLIELEDHTHLNIPKWAIYDVKNGDYPTRKYCHSLMKSVEI